MRRLSKRGLLGSKEGGLGWGVLSTWWHEEDGDSSAVPGERTRGSRHRLKYRKFPLKASGKINPQTQTRKQPLLFFMGG